MARRRDVNGPSRDGDPCVVLVRPRYAENVGAAARALENAGGGELRLVAPNEKARAAIAERVARGGEPRLRAARTFASLEEAIADVDLAVATSHKTGRHRRPLLPWELTTEVVDGLRPRSTALVFGPEDHGLLSDEVDLCHRLVTIPSHGPLNLAQSVIVLLYELKMRPRSPAGDRGVTPLRDRSSEGHPSPEVPAVDRGVDDGHADDDAGVLAAVAAARAALSRVGYPRHRKPIELEMSRLADLLSRAALAPWEVNLLVGMFRHVDRWAARHTPASGAPAAEVGADAGADMVSPLLEPDAP